MVSNVGIHTRTAPPLEPSVAATLATWTAPGTAALDAQVHEDAGGERGEHTIIYTHSTAGRAGALQEHKTRTCTTTATTAEPPSAEAALATWTAPGSRSCS